MFGELVPQGGGDPIPLRKTKLLVGRRDSCDIALRFPNVSSRHCELELQEGYWLVRDLDSSNGTKVNGVRVRVKWIMPGDELAFAKHRFKIHYEVPAGALPPPPLDDADDNILGTSLLEKAGLVRRHRQLAPDPPGGRNSSISDRRSRAPLDDDDQVMRWLGAEDDDDD